MEPSKVLNVEANEDGTVGGSHQCLHDIVKGLDRARFVPSVVFYENNRFVQPIRDLGVDVTLWDRSVERAHRRHRGIVAKAVLIRNAPAAVVRRARFLRAGGFGIVHLNNSPCTGFEDWLPAARLAGIPIVAHARGPYVAPGTAVGRWLTTRFDRVIAISRYIAADMAAHGVRKPSIRMIHDGIDVAGWRAKAVGGDAVRRELDIAPGRLLVAMAGHLRPWKGQDVVLRALSRLATGERSRILVAFAGAATADEAVYERGLHETVAREKLEECVCFLGARSDVPALMAAADVVLHASTEPEPFGLVVIEGMALGKIVVASRLGGPLETVSEDAGMLFDPREPSELTSILQNVARNPAGFEAMKEAAKARARQFDTAVNVGAIENVYEELLGRGSS
jgi:glycosyltransferase involved in cell wall biosynthesis